MPSYLSNRAAHHDVSRKVLCVLMALLMVAAYSVAGTVGQAGAAGPLPAPTNLTPNSTTAGPNPVLTWNPVAGAEYYKVSHPDQNGNVRTDTAYAASFATTVDYPVGVVNWSVTAYDDHNAAGNAANASFTNQSADGPTLTCPNSPVNFPVQSPEFSWTAVPGTKTYTLSVSTTSTFVPASTDTYQTQSSSYTLTTGVPDNQTYYAKVSGSSYNGINTPASAKCSYQVVWSPGATGQNDAQPTLKSPVDNSTVRDVILRWDALKGAASYEVQVSPNGDWTNNLYYDIITDSTTWSPAKTLNNGSYYWRVRGIDNAGNFSRWSDYPSTSAGDAREFNVAPLAAPILVYPGAGHTIANPDLRFAWKPVPGAAAYELQWSANSSFSYANQNDEINHTCITNHTDWSPYAYVTPPGTFYGPGGNGACRANTRDQSPNYLDGTTVYWHVRALDDYTQNELASPWNTNSFDTVNHRPPTNRAFVSTWSPPQRFFFNSATPTVTGPANGATVATPMITWARVSGAEYYIVTYSTNQWGWDNTNKVCTEPTGRASNHTAKTSALSYTPDLVSYPRKPDTDRDPDSNWDQCPINVSFSVQAVDFSDRSSPLPLARSFTWSGYSLSGTSGTAITLGSTSTDSNSGQRVNPADNATIQGIPRFTWTPVVGADHYQVWWYDNPAGSVFTPMQDYNFGVNQTDPLTESFTPTQIMRAETGAWQVVALSSGNTVIASSPKRTLTVAPPNPSTLVAFTTRDKAGDPVVCHDGCTTPSTPLITWNTDSTVDSYKVYIALDPDFTNVQRVYQTGQNSIRPVEALPDNQAGQSYYVAIQPVIDNWRTGGADMNGTIYGDYGAAIDPANVWSFHKQSAPVTGLRVLDPGSTVKANSTSICDDSTGVTTISDVPTFCWNTSSADPYTSGDFPPRDVPPIPSGDVGAMSYHIQVSTTPDYSNVIDEAWVDQPSYTPYEWPKSYNGGYSPGSYGAPTWRPNHKTYPDGPIYWRVQAVDSTGNGLTYGVYDSNPATPTTADPATKDSTAVTLTAPNNNGTLGNTPSLSWGSKTFAARYQVQVARNGDANFSNPNLAFNQYTDLTSITPSNNNSVTSGTSLPVGTYVWRVRAVDADTNSGAWSVVRTFTVDPAAPSLTAPNNGVSFNDQSGLTFKWSTVPGAVRYRFYLSQNNPPTTGGVRVDTVSNAWSLDRNLQNGTWHWEVQSLDASNQVLASSGVRSFTYFGTRPTVSNLRATAGAYKTVNLSWTGNPVSEVGPIDHFVISRFDSASATTPAATKPVSGTATSNAWAGLDVNTKYWFTITPFDAGGPGTESSKVSAVAPGHTPAYSYIYKTYADFLNAQPTPTQLSNAERQLGTNPSSTQKKTYVSALANSDQWLSSIVDGFYLNTLGRPADAGGKAYWVNILRTKKMTVAQVASHFYSAREYFRGYGKSNNRTWVLDLYDKLLGRSGATDPDGVSYWVTQIGVRGRSWVSYQMYQGHESCKHRVADLYQKLLGRGPDQSGWEFWAAQVKKRGDISLAENLAISTEYQTDAVRDHP